MYIKFLNINKDKSKRLWLIILTALTVASILVFTTIYLLISKENVKLGNFSNISNNCDQIFTAKSYKYESNVTVISNKTTNKYNIEERYEKNDLGVENFYIKTHNELGDEIDYEITNNSLQIKSSTQLNEYILNNYVVKKTNLISIATFISLYNDISKITKNSNIESKTKIEIEEYSDKIMYRILLNDYNIEELSDYLDILNDSIGVKKLELLISKSDKKPVEYIVYNKDDLAYIDVNYTFFDINNNFK